MPGRTIGRGNGINNSRNYTFKKKSLPRYYLIKLTGTLDKNIVVPEWKLDSKSQILYEVNAIKWLVHKKIEEVN